MGKDITDFNIKRYKDCLNLDALDLDESELCFKDSKFKSVGFNTGAKETVANFLCHKFELSNKELFLEKFNESVSGDGQEFTKISTLHSSSLCALLCFYNVNKNHPLEYEGITYDDVHFEFKNKVISKPSNMDVVLTGKDKKGRSAILFVECKFSEFIGAGKYKLGEAYTKEPYKHIFDNFEYDKQKVFQYGLKQLVAHYIGIRNFVNNEYYLESSPRLELYRKFDIVSFVEVVFRHDNDDYRVYVSESKEVFKALEKEKEKDKLNINLLGTVTYQDLFSGKNSSVIDKKVKAFYKLD